MPSIDRLALQDAAFPNGIPRLWCPMLTHFAAAHQPDVELTEKHLSELAPMVHGILVPGTTGEGWAMDDTDVHRLLDIVLPAAHAVGVQVLLGVLKTDLQQVLQALDALDDYFRHSAVVGVTVCPIHGAELSQAEIGDAMRQVLMRGQPTALYQLPQVTHNELAPQTVAMLAAEFGNFLLFKDTSGRDRVALSGLDFGGVNFVRGSEQGGYAHWTRHGGGPYDGFLLSTANALAPELSRVLQALDVGDIAAAEQLSNELERLVTSVFTIVESFPEGNAFANANKVLYHMRCHGATAAESPAPMLITGQRLPRSLIEQALQTVQHHHAWLVEN